MKSGEGRSSVAGNGILTLMIMIVGATFTPGQADADEVSVPVQYAWTFESQARNAPPPRWEEIQQFPLSLLYSAERAELSAPSKIEGLARWNRGGNQPVQNGFARGMESPVTIELSGSTHTPAADSHLPMQFQGGHLMYLEQEQRTWTASVEVKGAYRLRLKLSDLNLAPTTKFWVYNHDGENVGPFGLELMDDEGNLWTPSVAGPTVSLLVLSSEATLPLSFAITDVLEMFQLDSTGTPVLGSESVEGLSCFQEAQCFSSSTYSAIDAARRATAIYFYVKNGVSGYQCSGGLVNDKDSSTFIPYFLTARHCIDSGASASSIEAFWDFRPSSCGASIPSLSSLQRSNGSQLLATGSAQDFSFLQLNSIPSGRSFMGWTRSASAISPGTQLHAVSHPLANAQQYSQATIDGGSYQCSNSLRSDFIYQTPVIGGVSGGSSGALVSLDNGQIVGIFKGICGPLQETDHCSTSNYQTAGMFREFFPAVEPYLDNETSSQAELALTRIDAEFNTYSQGELIRISNTTENLGGMASGNYEIRFYLSTNTTISVNDYYLDKTPVSGPINAGEAYTRNTTMNIPSTIPDGQYYVGGILQYSDANPDNHTSFDATRITLGGGSTPITAGFNGNWWGGIGVNGEGAQIEVVDNGNGGLTFIATFYTYDNNGNQVFLVAVGTVNGDTAEVTVSITSGGRYGQGYGSSGFEQTWGSGTFRAVSCGAIDMTLRPNSQFVSQGFHTLSYRLERLATPVLPCP